MRKIDRNSPCPRRDQIIAQVERVFALLLNATYPGGDMWRYRTACELLSRGASAEAEDGESDVASQAWFAAAVKILTMESKNGFNEWVSFSPHEQSEIVKMFLPAAKALIDWVNAIRRRESEEQECDWREIGFMNDAPEGVILNKLGGYENGPNEELLKRLLFVEDHRCEIIYNPLFFKQIDHGLVISGEDINYEEPFSSADIQECNAVIRALYEDRAQQEGRMNERIPTLTGKTFQEIIGDLSESNEPYLERKRRENGELAKEIDNKLERLKEESDAGLSMSFMSKRYSGNKRAISLYDVFISHATADKEPFVDSLRAGLRRLNINVWYDADEIDWGDNLKAKIFNGLDKCRFGIVVISSEFLGRAWTEMELNELLQRQDKSGQKTILPLLYNLTVDEMKNRYPILENFKARVVKANEDVKDIVIDFARIMICALKSDA